MITNPGPMRTAAVPSRSRWVASAAAIVLALLKTAPLPGQTFRAEVDRVLLDVAVTRQGKPVAGLAAEDFTVFDGDRPQRVDRVMAVDTLPVSLLLAFDTSASVAGERLTSLIEAGRSALASLRARDRVALITFSTPVTVRVPLTADFGAAASTLSTLRAGGGTALRDATWTTVQLRPGDTSRPVVLLFTDGSDSSSWLSAADALDGVRRAGVVIHAVGLGRRDYQVPAPRPDVSLTIQAHQLADGESAGWRFLEELVTASGGRLWSADTPAELPALFTRAIDEMRARYVLAIDPERPIRPGWHRLDIRVKGGGDIKAQAGYFVPRPRSE